MTETETVDSQKLAQAIRFAFVCFILAISYFGIRASLSIPSFEMVFKDMLGGRPLPLLTMIVARSGPVFMIFSFAVPAVAVWTLFRSCVVSSFYILGILCLATVAESVFLFQALSEPIFEIVKQMGGTP